MFDTYVQRVAPAYPQTVTKHEHRAPTDESVKLLREMEDKALKSIIHHFRVESNFINGTVTIFEFDHIQQDVLCCTKFTLNGQEIIIQEPMHRDDCRANPDWIWDKLCERLSGRIARIITEKAAHQHAIETIRKKQ